MGEANEIAAHSIKAGVETREGKRGEIESGQCHRHKTDGKLKSVGRILPESWGGRVCRLTNETENQLNFLALASSFRKEHCRQ